MKGEFTQSSVIGRGDGGDSFSAAFNDYADGVMGPKATDMSSSSKDFYLSSAF